MSSLGTVLAVALFLPAIALPLNAGGPSDQLLTPPQPTGEPAADRLAEPVPGKAPTQVERGRLVYYYNCMPCHGDRGQGLTGEFRLAWPEDHQNCWARGCHTGKSELSAFAIPHEVPAVAGTPWALGRFEKADALFAYLRETQPPQRPGALSNPEYWEVTAFLLNENGRPAEAARLAAGAPGPAGRAAGVLAAGAAPLLVLAAARRPGKTHA
jgi:cytochrome c